MLLITLGLDDESSKISWVEREGSKHGKSVWAVGLLGGRPRKLLLGSHEAVDCLWNVLFSFSGSV
jgi:hypothetical protein